MMEGGAARSARLDALSPQQKALLALRLQAEQGPQIPCVDRHGRQRFITSFAQRRFWFLDQWNRGSAIYNTHLASKIVGPLDVPALQRCFDDILRRHEILRMVYVNVEDEVYCEPHPDPRLPIRYRNLAAEVSAGGNAVERFIRAEIEQGFDLGSELPIRVTLLELAPDEHVLVVVIHHIASDMWSFRVLPREIEAFYNAHAHGKPVELVAPVIQYLDYAHWQRQQFAGPRFDQQIAYWQEALKGAPGKLSLPADFPRPELQTYKGEVFEFEMPVDLAALLHGCASDEKVTPFVLTLSAFLLLIGRYARSTDIVVGSPVAGRNSKALESLIGLFINTLAIRVDLADAADVRALLQRTKKAVAGAMANQDVPFEKLVEALKIERDLSYPPIFQVMFNFQSIKKTAFSLDGLETDHFLLSNGTTKFDLNLSVKYIDDQIVCMLGYNTDLFLPATIERMAGHYLHLLRQMAADPSRAVDSLELVTPAECRKLLSVWHREDSEDWPSLPCLHALFEAQASTHPQRIAAVCEGRQYSYSDLNARANRLAHYLHRLGVRRGEHVGVFMERSLDLLVAILAAIKAGAAYVPLDPVFPAERIRLILADAGIGVLITESRLQETLGVADGLQCLPLDRDWPLIAVESAENPRPGVHPGDLLYVLYTSGSTGRPKGVAVSHGNYLNYYFGVTARMQVPPGLKYAIASTFAADLATINVWAALNTGGEIHILSHECSVDPQAYAAYFREHGIDVIKMVPSHFKALMAGGNLRDIIPDRLLILAGEASYWDMIEAIRQARPSTDIQIHYGPTETTVSVLTYRVPATRPVQATSTLPLGRPIANAAAYILDERMQPVPVGVPGELYIAGPGVSQGYLGQAGLTAEKFLSLSLEGEAPQRMYRTGDIVRHLDDAAIEFLGRADEQVKIRGFRIELGEINAALKACAGIHDAFVAVCKDAADEARLAAYLVMSPDCQPDIPGVRASLQARLPAYMIPHAFVLLERLPLNANGKVDRAALPGPGFGQPAEGGEILPRNPHEQRIAAIWMDVLGLSSIGIHDNFFALGGDSFKALRVVRGIDPSLSILELFKHPTIAELAALLLQEARSTETEILHRISSASAAIEELAIICVPFAGGSALAYKPLAEALPGHHALYAVQIPGHDFSRPDEALQSIEAVAQRCADEIRNKVRADKLIVYGHCLGGALALEIARVLEAQGFNLIGVCMGGNFPVPQLPGRLFLLWNKLFPRDRRLSNRAYMDLLRSLGGFSEQLDPAERDFIIESLRHDRRESERYFAQRYAEEAPAKLRAPLYCVVGELDRTTEFYAEQFHDWKAFAGKVDLSVIPGAGHYFFKHQARALADLIEARAAVWQDAEASVGTGEGLTDAIPAPEKASLNTFLWFVLGQFVSMMGSNLSGFAMGIWVYNQSGAFMDFAATLIFHRLPGILVLPVAGALADRVDRRQILIWANVVSAAVALLIAGFFYTNSLQTWHIYLAVAVTSIATGFQRPALLAAVAQLSPKRYLGHANGLLQLATSTGNVLAPLLGGLLVSVLSLSHIILIDFLSFVFCIVTLLLIRFPNALFRKSEEPFLTEMAGGWKYILKRHSFVALVVFFVASNLLLGMANVLITPLVLSFESTVVLGLITSATGIGGLVGGIAMGLWGGTRRRAEGMVGFGILMGMSFIVMGLQPSVGVVMAGVFVYGVALAMMNAHWQTLIQSKVRAELLARVFAVNQLFALPTIPLGYFIGGWLSDNLFKTLFVDQPQVAAMFGWLVGSGADRGIGLLFVLIGLLTVVWSVAGMMYRPLRYMDDIIPDAIPGPVFIRDRNQIQEEEDRELERIKTRTALVIAGELR